MKFLCFSCGETDPCVLNLRQIDEGRLPTDCPFGFNGGIFGVHPKWKLPEDCTSTEQQLQPDSDQ